MLNYLKIVLFDDHHSVKSKTSTSPDEKNNEFLERIVHNQIYHTSSKK